MSLRNAHSVRQALTIRSVEELHLGGVKVGGIAEELAYVNSNAIHKFLDLSGGALVSWESLHEYLSDVVGNCGHLEHLLKEAVNHVGDVAVLTFVAELEPLIERLVIITVVGDQEKSLLEVDCLGAPVEAGGAPVVEDGHEQALGLFSEAGIRYLVGCVLIHTLLVPGDKAAEARRHEAH